MASIASMATTASGRRCYYPYFLWNDDRRDMLWGNFGTETQNYAPDLIQNQTLNFIEATKTNHFCFYAFEQPHAEMFARKPDGEVPWQIPAKRSYKEVDSGPSIENLRRFTAWAHAAFAAMVEVLDDDLENLSPK